MAGHCACAPPHDRPLTAPWPAVLAADSWRTHRLFKPLMVLRMNPLQPKKLLNTKWTALQPVRKDKHFLVTKVVLPEVEGAKIEWVEIEAVFSQARQTLAWRALQDDTVWAQGWV